jgi:hypothetical protein
MQIGLVAWMGVDPRVFLCVCQTKSHFMEFEETTYSLEV